MPPSKWDDEEEENSAPNSPIIAARRKFDDEEEEDVLESWDAAEDSEVEREKAKKAAEAKAKAEAEAKANHKSRSQRIEEKRQENMRKRLEAAESSDEEDDAVRRARARAAEKDSDLMHAADLLGEVSVSEGRSGSATKQVTDFGDIGISKNRSASKPITLADPKDPGSTIDLSSLSIFNPQTKDQFTKLRETLVPLLTANAKKAQYSLFLQEFSKQLAKELPSDQIKKIASGLTTLSNEKMKEEKAAEKGGKKSKAAKTKVSLVATRDNPSRPDLASYDDDFGDDDFM